METKSEENQLKIAIPVLDMPTANYENALRELGARPVVIKEVCDPQEYDGLLLPGGDDVDPARFGQEINGSLGISPELDALQFEVLDRFVKAGKPVLGICRGHQVINIYFGGDLIQDLGEKMCATEGPEIRIKFTGALQNRGHGWKNCTVRSIRRTAHIIRQSELSEQDWKRYLYQKIAWWRRLYIPLFRFTRFSGIRSGCALQTAGTIPWMEAA